MKVGVIGAGTMGSGIAQAFVQCEGYEVALCDITEEFAAGGKKKIEAALGKLVKKGKKTTLKVANSPITAKASVKWKTSNKKVASVTSKGVVKGLKKGRATITAYSGKVKMTFKVTVK